MSIQLHTDTKERLGKIDVNLQGINDFISRVKGMALLVVFMTSLLGAAAGAVSGAVSVAVFASKTTAAEVKK
jgi:uncharacterized membrane protein